MEEKVFKRADAQLKPKNLLQFGWEWTVMDVEQVTGEQVCWSRWEDVPVSQPHRQGNNV